jgi:hypothetical protein
VRVVRQARARDSPGRVAQRAQEQPETQVLERSAAVQDSLVPATLPD